MEQNHNILYINIQTGEELDWNRVEGLKDNTLLKHRPDLWIEWDFQKNKELGYDIYKMTKSSGKRVWWIGSECCHPWQVSISHRTRVNGSNCPYCNKNNPRTLKGFNDLWTTHPEIANKLENSEEGYLYSKRSDVIVNWKCPDCGNIIKRAIKDATRRGVNCQRCTDGISYGEKVVYNLLKDNNIKFYYDKSTTFSENKRYDFYLPDYSIIIEVHGEQHTKQATGFFGENRTLEQEIENDKFKRDIALLNNIDNYIELHITDNNAIDISEEVIKSDLLTFLNLKDINWNQLLLKSQKSLVLEVCKIYEEDGNITTKDLMKTFSLSRSTIIKYLKRGSKLGICNYIPRSRDVNIKNPDRYNSKAVVQLDLNNEYVSEYVSISQATKVTGCNNIRLHCMNNTSTKGYKWMFLSEYKDSKNK